MEDVSGRDTTGCCPHVDRNDPRCGTRFSLGRIGALSQALPAGPLSSTTLPSGSRMYIDGPRPFAP